MKTLVTTIVLILFVSVLSCNQRKDAKTNVRFRMHLATGQKVYLFPIPFAGEPVQILDSALVKTRDETITFTIPQAEERPYRIKVENYPIQIFFINDAPLIVIEANFLNHNDYAVKNSPATTSVKNFLSSQRKMAEKLYGRKNQNGGVLDNRNAIFSDQLFTLNNGWTDTDFYQRFINYADTVSSPGSFLYVYNNVDFGRDFGKLKAFILKAAKRFPENTSIQRLKAETLDFVKIFEEEYEVGQYLPELILPDKNGNKISTYSFKGKYLFIDFWSTWCPACLKYENGKEEAKRKFQPPKFEVVSIALDPEKAVWKQYLDLKKFSWPQLIDEKGWKGETIRLLKIDSIPFNFFLAPDGKILSKAIKPDSVVAVLSRNIR